MHSFADKWGIVAKAAAVAIPLLGLKALVNYFDLNIITVGPVITALIAGVFFVLAIILAGVLGDFKESEKIPGEMALSLKTLRSDSRLLGTEWDSSGLDLHIKDLLRVINANFMIQTRWHLKEVNAAIQDINRDIIQLEGKKAPLQLLLRFKAELTNIERLSNRVDSIIETSFIPGAYAIAQLAVTGALFVLLVADIQPQYEGLLLFGVISLILIAIILLIWDMDNPFEGYARVDLSILQKLEKSWSEQDISAFVSESQPERSLQPGS
jgi:hypothetical protein